MIVSGAIGPVPCCCQVKQPGLVKEAVAPPIVVWSSSPAFLPGSLPQDAPQPSPDPAIDALERIKLAEAEVVVPSPQYWVNPLNDAF